MMCKKYMLIVFTNYSSKRYLTDRSPIIVVRDIYNKNPLTTLVEVYKWTKEKRDYTYVCNISIERGLCDD